MTRSEFARLLVQTTGLRNIYFTPERKERINFPCILYEPEGMTATAADNINYRVCKSYKVTVCSKDLNDVTETTGESLMKLPTARFVRYFCDDGVYHWVYKIYSKY